MLQLIYSKKLRRFENVYRLRKNVNPYRLKKIEPKSYRLAEIKGLIDIKNLLKESRSKSKIKI